MSQTLNWGILGAGAIAQAFARGLTQIPAAGRLLAVGSRSQESADKFAAQFNVPKRYVGYENLLADPEVQAVYICTPHPMHAPWAIRAAEAGKHVLCEKPFALNHAQAQAMFEAARAHHVYMMEAFMYRCHPQTAKVVELIRQGAIGEVRLVQATFSFQAGFNPDSRLFNNDLAGGGIMDVGCYPVSLTRLVAGAALGRDFADPVEVTGAGHLGTTGVDEWAAGTLKFERGIIAQIATGVALNQDNSARIYGSEGRIELPNPWLANRQTADTGKIILRKKGTPEPQIIEVSAPATSFALEADLMARAIAQGRQQAPAPAMSWGDTLGNMQTLDRWRKAVGLTYNQEKEAGYPRTTVAGRPLAVAAKHNMKYGRLPGLDKPVSRLVMGVDNQMTLPHAAVMFDDFFARGGNTFDTAWIYGGGGCERMLGQWIKVRGLREQVVVIGKGAHTPACDPVGLTWQLQESLQRLQTDHLDVYIMHRDNPAVPVGEFVDVLNEHVRAGRIKLFGGSNWSIPRLEEANAYAQRKGLQGFAVMSNNFSLARMVAPVWHGCISASDADSRAWLTRTQMPLLPWSSQARGFFTPRADLPAETQPDKSLVQSWYSPDNFQRRRRAMELAQKKGVQPINIALAYVLCQPFPTFPLIGPRTLEETRTSLPALDVELTPAELRWLNLEDAQG